MREVFDVVEEFFAHDPVREACRTAVGRLPRAQRDVIDRYFFDEVDVPEIAARRAVAPSTVYNQKASAQTTLHDDDVFFSALYSLR
jgi:DNA-directed RNA polymerase specialized sigma24 family protein